MVVEHLDIFVRQLFTVHLLEPVGQHTPVQADEVRFGQFADQRCHILALDIGIRIEFAAGRRIRSLAVVHQELQLVANLPVFGVFLPVEHVGFGDGIVTFGHEGYLHLVLDLLDRSAVRDADPAQDVGDDILRGETSDREECLGDRPLYLFNGEQFPFPISFDNECFHKVSGFCPFFAFVSCQCE